MVYYRPEVMRGILPARGHAWYITGARSCVVYYRPEVMRGILPARGHAWYITGPRSCVVYYRPEVMRGIFVMFLCFIDKNWPIKTPAELCPLRTVEFPIE